jgi:hypothetical protein
MHFPRVQLFQILDSLLAGIAVVSAASIAINYFQENGGYATAEEYLYALGAGILTAGISLIIGFQRGKANVDGVFLGPLVRSATILVIIGGAIDAFNVPPKFIPPPPCEPYPACEGSRAPSSNECEERISRLREMLKKIEAEGGYSALDVGPRKALDEAASKVGIHCAGDEAAKAYDEFKAVRKTGASVDNDHDEKQEGIADLIGMSFKQPSKSLPINKKLPPIIKSSLDSNGSPDLEIIIPHYSPPPPFQGDTPQTEESVTRTTVYRHEYRPTFIEQILGGLDLGFGVSITVKEIESAIRTSTISNRGNPIATLLSKKATNPQARARLLSSLLLVGQIDRQVGGIDNSAVETFVRNDPPMGICFRLVWKVTQDPRFEFIENASELMLNWRDGGKREAVSNDVIACVKELIPDINSQLSALEQFKIDKGDILGF